MPQIPFAFECIQSAELQFLDFWKKINIYNFFVYHQITIRQICGNQPNSNLVVHILIAIGVSEKLAIN